MSEHAGARMVNVARASKGRADEDVSSDAALWRDVANAKELDVFFGAWLAIVARSFAGIVRAEARFDRAGDGALVPVARWTAGGVATNEHEFYEEAKPILEAVLKSRQPAIEAATDQAEPIFAAHPFLFGEALCGVVVVQFVLAQGTSARRVLRHLQWASAWVEAYLHRTTEAGASEAGRRATALIDIVNAAVSAPRHHDACHAVASTMSRLFGCERVSVGWRQGQSTRMVALLQTATFERKYEAGRVIEAAMDEAIDQNSALVAPAPSGAPYVALAQEELTRSGGAVAVATIPLLCGEGAVGAVTLERFVGAAFSPDDIALGDALCATVGPILADKKEKDSSVPALALKRLQTFAGKLIGPRHLGLKLAVGAALAVATFLIFATDTYRINARAQMHGEVRRVLSAPFDGYIKVQNFRAGQIVAQDAVLAELQDNDLTLDRLRHVAQRRQYQLELDRALSRRDLAQANITNAQIEQKEAEIELAEQMLTRTQIRAPFAGVIVSGDLSQSVGRPVARGDTLFELAPLDQYRVTLIVPEIDIQHVRPRQRGHVLLAALPERSFALEVTNVTPVAHAQDGVNGFEVHSVLLETDPRIRPGMEGLAKLDAGERSLVWIWTHGLFHWLRIKLWAWIP